MRLNGSTLSLAKDFHSQRNVKTGSSGPQVMLITTHSTLARYSLIGFLAYVYEIPLGGQSGGYPPIAPPRFP
jgi:hypothetical protein